jgi:hypothetical protein
MAHLSARGEEHDRRHHDHVDRRREQRRMQDIAQQAETSAIRRNPTTSTQAATIMKEVGAT